MSVVLCPAHPIPIPHNSVKLRKHRTAPKLFATAHSPSHVPNSACQSPLVPSSALLLRPAASFPGHQAPPSTRCALELSCEPPSGETLNAGWLQSPYKYRTCMFSFPLAVCAFLAGGRVRFKTLAKPKRPKELSAFNSANAYK